MPDPCNDRGGYDDGGGDDDGPAYEPEYELEKVRVCAGEFVVNTVVPPPLEFMSTLHTEQKEISGRQVWTGSLFLAETLSMLQKREDTLLNGKRILELGSGTGILGMAVSRMSQPACLALTDGDDEAVVLLCKNLTHPFNQINVNVVQATLFTWGKDHEGFSNWCRQAWPNEKSWADDTSSSSAEGFLFDCIIAGDVLYKEELPQVFFATVQAFLHSAGTLWLCHVPRASVTQNVVLHAATEAGFLVETVSTNSATMLDGVVVEGCPMEDLKRAVVYRMTLRQ